MGTDSMREVEDFVGDCHLAWEKHPDYSPPDRSKPGWIFLGTPMIAVFTHTPGKYNHTESYLIGTLITIFSEMQWCISTWKAKFERLQPIVERIQLPGAMEWIKRFDPHEYDEIVALDPEATVYQRVWLHPTRITTIPYSYAGQGAEMTARLRLKSLLPKHLQKYVSKARSGNRKAKHFYFPVEKIQKWSTFDNGRRHINYPPEARAQKKWRLWFDRFVPLKEQRELAQLIPLEDFWRCATGDVHPNDVEKFFVPPLFRGTGICLGEIRPATKRQTRRRESKSKDKQMLLIDAE